MTDKHCYQEPDEEEGFLYVREWEDHRLEEEWRFLLKLFHATTSELAFRGDRPEYRDDTGNIHADDAALYALADRLTEFGDTSGNRRND